MALKTVRLLLSLGLLGLLTACGSPEERAADYLTKAQELFAAEDYVTARIEALNAAQIEPKNAEVRFLLAEIEEKEQKYRQAIGHLLVAVDSDPAHIKARVKLGNYYVLAKVVDEAAVQVEAALAIAPDNAEVRLLNARLLYLQDDKVASMAEVDAALELDPLLLDAIMFKAGIETGNGNIDSALMLVDTGIEKLDPKGALTLRQFRVVLLRSAGRMPEVEEDLKVLIQDFPDEDNYALSLAQLYASQDRVDEAEEILRSIVEKHPTDVDRRIGFARFIAEQQGTDAAIAVLEEFSAELPDELTLQLALGRLYEFNELPDDALSIYSRIAAATPTSKEGLAARNRIAVIKIQRNETDDAKKLIEEIIVDEPDNSEALLVRAAFKFTARSYDDAITDLRTVLRTDEQSERALLLLARSHVGAGNAELAQDAYRRLIEIKPGHPEASNELAELLARRGDMDLAENVLRERLEVDPKDRKAASGLVQALIVQGNLTDAETEARNMLEFKDPTGLAEFQLGRVMQAQESGPEAIAAYKLALEKNPDAVQPLEGLISVLVKNDQSDEAIEYLTEHLTRHPDQSAAKYLLASVYARQGDTDAARKYLGEIIVAQPGNARAYAALANTYPDDAEQRIKIYRRGFDANPENAAISLLLSSEFERAGQFDNAIALYEETLAKNSENDLAANNLAALLLDQRTDAASFATALELAQRFEESREPALVDTLGWAHYRTGDYKKAIRYLEIAVVSADQVALLHYHLGMAYYAAENPVQARQELEKAIELGKVDFVGIDEARATLKKLQETAASN